MCFFSDAPEACRDAAAPHCIRLSKKHRLSFQTLSKHSVVGLHRLIILNLEVDNVYGVLPLPLPLPLPSSSIDRRMVGQLL